MPVITSLAYKKSWDSKYGDANGKMHTWNIDFDTEDRGEVNTKTDNAPYKVGDTVEIKDKKVTEYGNKYKVGLERAEFSKSDRVQGQVFKGTDKPNQRADFAPQSNGARVGMIVNNACQSLTAQKKPLTCKVILEVAEEIEKATKILEKGDSIPEESKSPSASTQSPSKASVEKKKVADAGLDAVEEQVEAPF